MFFLPLFTLRVLLVLYIFSSTTIIVSFGFPIIKLNLFLLFLETFVHGINLSLREFKFSLYSFLYILLILLINLPLELGLLNFKFILFLLFLFFGVQCLFIIPCQCRQSRFSLFQLFSFIFKNRLYGFTCIHFGFTTPQIFNFLFKLFHLCSSIGNLFCNIRNLIFFSFFVCLTFIQCLRFFQQTNIIQHLSFPHKITDGTIMSDSNLFLS